MGWDGSCGRAGFRENVREFGASDGGGRIESGRRRTRVWHRRLWGITAGGIGGGKGGPQEDGRGVVRDGEGLSDGEGGEGRTG